MGLSLLGLGFPHQTWQTVKKRKWTHLTTAPSQPEAPTPFTSRNRFDELSQLPGGDTPMPEDHTTPAGASCSTQQREHKPSPIYLYSVTNYQDMVSYITTTLEEEQYHCKDFSDDTIKINVYIPTPTAG